MNISASITDSIEATAVASIMDITEEQFSDAAGYSSVTDVLTSYDADGNVTGYTYTTDVTDADGFSYSWTDTYDANWILTQSAYSDATGYSSVTSCEVSYDADGNITGYIYTTSSTDADGASYSWTDTYDANWTLTHSEYSDAAGYSSVTDVLTSYDSDGNVTGYTYTTSGTDADGFSYSWTDSYDANWTLTHSEYSDSTGYSSVTDVLTSYDADGNITGYTYTTSCTDPDGFSYSWTDSYDANWTLTQSAYSDATGYSSVTDVLTSYDADGNITGYTYTTDVTDADGSSYSWTDSYDANWTLTQSAYSDATGYSSVTDVLTSYDADGNVAGYTYTTDVTDADGSSYTWTDTYDANWTLTQSAYSDATGYSSVTDVLTSYDADGNITGYTYTTDVTDADGSSYSWTDSYDANWTLTQSAYSDATGYSSVTDVLTSYDADGNITGYTYTTDVTDADGSSYTWTDTYDANWTLTQSAYSDATGYSSVTDVLTSYDADGNITGYTYTTDVTDADGSSYSWTDTYDANWTLTQSAYSDATGYSSVTDVLTSYDTDGNVTGYTYTTDVTDADWSSYTWSDSYDANWTLTQSAYSDATGYSSVTDVLTSYDADGNITGYTYTTDVTDADGSSYSWTDTYDANWTLTQSAYSDATGYSSVTDVLTSYDADGNVTGYTYTTDVTDADGSSYTWSDSYDANWTLTQSAYSDATGYSSVTDILTSYDADGNITGYTYTTDVTDADGSSYSWTDTYDANWTLTQSAYSDATGYSSVTDVLTSYDADGNVTGYTYATDVTDADGFSYSWTDSYDANWTLTQSAYSDATGTTQDASGGDTEADALIADDYVDEFVFKTDSDSADVDDTDTYVVDSSSQYSPSGDFEHQSSSDSFVFDCNIYVSETVSLPDNTFI